MSLNFFFEQKADAPLGVLDLSNCRIEVALEGDKPNCFQLVIQRGYTQGHIIKHLPFTLSAETVDELQIWVTQLEHVIKRNSKDEVIKKGVVNFRLNYVFFLGRKNTDSRTSR